MKKVTYVCDMCAHVAQSEGELMETGSPDCHVVSHPFVVTGRNKSDCVLTMEVSIHNNFDDEFHLCNECIIGQLENIARELRDKKNT